MVSGGPDLRRTEAMDQGDGEIPQGGHNLWSIAGPQARPILPEGDIAHIMGTILDAPMPPIEVQQALRAGFGRREGGDEIDDFRGGFARFGDGAGELRDLRNKGPGQGKIGIQRLCLRAVT